MSVVFVVSLAALWAIVLFQTVLLLGIVRSIYADREAEPLGDDVRGAPAPDFSAQDLDGRTITKEGLLGRPAALLFVSPDCTTCAVTLNELEALRSKVDGAVVLMCRSSPDRCAQLAQTYGLRVPVVVDEDFALSRLFDVVGAPTAVLLRADGAIESYGRPMSPSDLEQELAQAGWDPVDGVPLHVIQREVTHGR